MTVTCPLLSIVTELINYQGRMARTYYHMTRYKRTLVGRMNLLNSLFKNIREAIHVSYLFWASYQIYQVYHTCMLYSLLQFVSQVPYIRNTNVLCF